MEPTDGRGQLQDSAVQRPHLPDAYPHDGGGGGLWWIWLIVVVGILAVGAAFLVPRFLHRGTAAGGPGAQGPRSVPVVVSKVIKGDIDLYLTGLGTVTALNTDAVHTRVDGQIMKVAYTEGQTVKAGDLLVQIDPRPFVVQLTQAQGLEIRDQALLKDAQLNLERFKSLLTQNLSITQAQVDTQQALVTQYEGAVKTDQGQIAAAQLNLTYCQVTAPIGGRIGLRLVDEGNIVHANDANPLAVIAQIQPISVVFNIAEDSIGRIMSKVQPDHPLPVLAYDRDMKRMLAKGKLLAVDNQVDPSSGTVKLKGVFDNTNFKLFPNEFVNARLQIETLKGVTIVPNAAVQRGPDFIFTYVVTDGKVDLRKIVIGPTEGDQTVVESGLVPGEVVVTDGVDKLQPGTQVTVREASRKKGPGTTQPSATQPAERAGDAHEMGAQTQPSSCTTRPAHSRHGPAAEGAE